MRNTVLLATSLGCTRNVNLVLQGLVGTVKEFRGDNDGATSAAAAENLNRAALCGVEYLALMCGFRNFLAGFFLFRMAGLADADDVGVVPLRSRRW